MGRDRGLRNAGARGRRAHKDERGGIIHRRGVADAAGVCSSSGSPGSTPRGSALIGFVDDDAAFIAGRIDSRIGNRVGLVGTNCDRT